MTGFCPPIRAANRQVIGDCEVNRAENQTSGYRLFWSMPFLCWRVCV